MKNFVSFIIKFLYPLSSLSLIFGVYLVNNGGYIHLQSMKIMGEDCCCSCCRFCTITTLDYIVHYGSYVVCFLGIFIIACIVKSCFKYLHKDQEPEVAVTKLDASGRDYMPSYLSYFFIALSINSLESLVVCFIILYVLTFCASTMAYNPLMLLFGYRFYSFRNANGKQIMVLTKCEIYSKTNIAFEKLGRINDFTYVDLMEE